MKGMLVLLLLAGALATSHSAFAGGCSQGTLDTYTTSGFSCTIDGNTFADWGYSPTAGGGASVVPAASVAVIPCPGASAFCLGIPTGEVGFVFTAPWGAASGQMQDAAITYAVTSPSKVLDALLLYGGFGKTGTGFASVAETLSIGGSLFVSDPPGMPASVSATFNPVSSLIVIKNIELAGGTDGTAAISEVVNAWSQAGVGVATLSSSVPEPGTLSLLGAGLLMAYLSVTRRLRFTRH